MPFLINRDSEKYCLINDDNWANFQLQLIFNWEWRWNFLLTSHQVLELKAPIISKRGPTCEVHVHEFQNSLLSGYILKCRSFQQMPKLHLRNRQQYFPLLSRTGFARWALLYSLEPMVLDSRCTLNCLVSFKKLVIPGLHPQMFRFNWHGVEPRHCYF